MNQTQKQLSPATAPNFDLLKPDEQELVNARDLHQWLGVEKKFADWVREKLLDYAYLYEIDYFDCFPKKGSKGRGGHNRKDYLLTLDCAKQLCMTANSEKGRQARLYFIKCEKKLRGNQDKEKIMQEISNTRETILQTYKDVANLNNKINQVFVRLGDLRLDLKQ